MRLGSALPEHPRLRIGRARRIAPADRALALLVAGGGILRLRGLGRSLDHDEVFTWVQYASLPWRLVARTYTAPNNHILHTYGAKLLGGLFGPSEWAIRLTALAAGLLGLVAAHLLARTLTGSRRAGLLAAAVLALSPVHTAYSQQARGYTLLVLGSTACAWLAARAVADRQPGPSSATPGIPAGHAATTGCAPSRAWGNWLAAAAAGFLAALALPSGAFLTAAVLAWAGGVLAARMVGAVGGRREAARRSAPAWLAAGLLTAAGVLWVYLPLRAELQGHAATWGTPLRQEPVRLLQTLAEAWAQVDPVGWPPVGGAVALAGAL
ncbi:MAG: glycosyltransferase family 39 protein, partial [Candidatus Latescibacterota bacterium]